MRRPVPFRGCPVGSRDLTAEVSEQRGQPGPPSRTAALHGACRYVEDACRLGHGVTLHVHEDECGPLLGGESGECGQELTVEVLALRRCLGGFMRFEELLEPFGVVDRRASTGGRFADPIKAGVDGDAVQPSGDGGLAAEGVGGPEGGDKRVLDGVRGFLSVAQGPYRHGPQPVAVAPYKLTEGVRFAGHMASEEV